MRCVPGPDEDPGRALHDLARLMRRLRPDADEQAHREAVARWHALAARRRGAVPLGPSFAWLLYRERRASLREEPGGRLELVRARAASVTMPPGIPPELAPVARVMIALAEREADEDGVFWIPCRVLGEATTPPASPMATHRRLVALGHLGHLEQVSPGDFGLGRGKRASRYRWHPVPLPGGAPWRSRPHPPIP